MARVRFLLKDPQHNVQGKKQSTLVLLVYRFPGNTRLVYSINESVSPDDWDFKAQEPKPTRNNTALMELRLKISNLRSFVVGVVRKAENDGYVLSVDALRDELDVYLNKRACSTVSISEYAILVYYQGKAEDNVKLIKATVRVLESFIPSITFASLNGQMINAYLNYLKKQSYKKNTVRNYVVSLNTIARHAVNVGGIAVDKSFFEAVRMISTGKEKVRRVVLSMDELKAMYDLQVDDPIERHVLDAFIRIIRKLAKKAGIDGMFTCTVTVGNEKKTITSPKYMCISPHTARRSFATNAHRAGIPPAIAMMFTGHKTIQQYMDYIMIVEDEAAEEYLNHPFFK